MPKLTKQLTAVAADKARPKADSYTLASGNGLFLLVVPGAERNGLSGTRPPMASAARS